ncbi:MAG: DNA modification methylase [Magnetococcales bacterium]|nr:DNA modification methylase [Magnetococcales bacterium]
MSLGIEGLKVSEWPTEKLIPYARNPRVNDHVVDKMAAVIREFGFRIPIIAQGDGTIVDGHLRLKAALKLGMQTVPVTMADDMSEAQIKAFRLLANRSATWADWDQELLPLEFQDLSDMGFDLELTGFDQGEISIGDAFEGDDSGGYGCVGDPEEVPSPPKIPVSRPGDLWLLGNHRLLCGSSLNAADVQRLMNGERAILFATDPPYLVDYDGTNHPRNSNRKAKAAKGDTNGTDGNKDWSDTYGVTWDDSRQGPELYEGFIRVAIDHAISDHAAWYCWHASKRQAMLEAVWEKMGAFVHQTIIWVKNNPVLTRNVYLFQHEPCFFGWVKGKKPPTGKMRSNILSGIIDPQYVGMEKEPCPECMGDVWHIKSLAGSARPEHPTPKPLPCFTIPMEQHVPVSGLCYEPFSGSGSQIMAGQVAKRRVYAMEISPVYVDVAVQRFIQATGKTAYLDASGGKSFEDVAAERGIDLKE